MDFLRQQLLLIQDRLSGLSASQKMLSGALVVIAVMTMLYWGRFASDREMVALLPGNATLSAEELSNVTAALRSKGIPYETSGNSLLVPATRQVEAIAEVTFREALPANSANAFDAMFKEISPFGSQQELTLRLNAAKEKQLAYIMQQWPDVKTAAVMINDSQRMGIGRREPRASIAIATKSGAGGSGAGKRVARAASTFVLNAVSGLSREHVGVTIDGTTFDTSGGIAGGGMGGSDLLDIIRSYEEATATKLRNQLSYIPGVLVTVSATVDNELKKTSTKTVDPKNKIVEALEQTSETTSTTDAPPPVEPGVVANTEVSVASASPALQAGSSTERTMSRNQVDYGTTQTETSTAPGAGKIVGATVRVPRSFFVQTWRSQSKQPQGDPTDVELTAVMEKEFARIRKEVLSITQIKGEDQVTVADFLDFEPLVGPGGPMLAAATATPGGFSLMATGHAKEVAIGVLAVTSLFMVSRMVKRSAPPEPLPAEGTRIVESDGEAYVVEGGKKVRINLDGSDDIAGDVLEGAPPMFGRELDDEVLETSQMVEQVSSFVKENPDTAAQLIRRWMNRD